MAIGCSVQETRKLITLAGGVHFDFEQPSGAGGSGVYELGCCSQCFVALEDRSADRRDKVADALGKGFIARFELHEKPAQRMCHNR